MPQPLHSLILADNAQDAELILQELRRSKFNPEGQVVGTEAEYLAGLHAGLDVVVADLGNSRFTGFRALELLQQRGLDIDIYGIVSNGQNWQFYRLTRAGEIFETGSYTTEFLPELLGALDSICAECAKNVP